MAALTRMGSNNSGTEKFNHQNSKWLQANISDPEMNVKAMIKILEEDSDSFAKRAELYYKNRPELIHLVKEFYGSYRSLAEKYDVAVGFIRQPHVSMSLSDDPVSEPETSERAPLGRSVLDTGDTANSFSPNVRSLRLSEERLKARVLKETERANKAEQEILNLKGSLLDLSFEKDEAWDRVSQLESELSQIDLKRLSESERLNERYKLEMELMEKKVVLHELEIENLNMKLMEIERSKV